MLAFSRLHINGMCIGNDCIFITMILMTIDPPSFRHRFRFFFKCFFFFPFSHISQTLLTQPKENIYGTFGVFCPSAHIEHVDLLETETILIDWTAKMYLNFTHIAIMNRIDAFYQKYGVMERLGGDIYVAQRPFAQIELDM